MSQVAMNTALWAKELTPDLDQSIQPRRCVVYSICVKDRTAGAPFVLYSYWQIR
jgi:hypothetical protein